MLEKDRIFQVGIMSILGVEQCNNKTFLCWNMEQNIAF